MVSPSRFGGCICLYLLNKLFIFNNLKSISLDAMKMALQLPSQGIMTLNRWLSTLLTLGLSLGVAAYTTTSLTPAAYAQETTGGLLGTVKDASGAVVPNAQVSISSPSLAGGKTSETDGKGYYRFANLPPGPYVI